MNIKCTIIVGAWLRQILVTGCEVKFFLFTQTCQLSSCILSKCLCHIKSAYRGDEGSVTNEDTIGVPGTGVFIQSSPVQMHLKTTTMRSWFLSLLEILIVAKSW